MHYGSSMIMWFYATVTRSQTTETPTGEVCTGVLDRAFITKGGMLFLEFQRVGRSMPTLSEAGLIPHSCPTAFLRPPFGFFSPPWTCCLVCMRVPFLCKFVLLDGRGYCYSEKFYDEPASTPCFLAKVMRFNQLQDIFNNGSAFSFLSCIG